MLEATIRWLFFIFLSFFPLVLSFILIKVKITRVKTWSELLKGGELFLFSTTISASSIVSIFNVPSKFGFGLKLITLYLLMIVLLISSGMFSVFFFLKLNEVNLSIDEKLFVHSLTWWTILAVILNYLAFIQGHVYW